MDCSETSAMTGLRVKRGRNGATGGAFEERQLFAVEFQADRFADPECAIRRHAGLEQPLARLDSNDLVGAEIFRTIDRAAQSRAIVEADMLRPYAKRQFARRQILMHLRKADLHALQRNRARALAVRLR